VSDPLLDELRREYRASARVRLEEVDALLRGLPDSAAVRALARHFHAFSGMGATYGFPRISQLGDDLEASILPLVRSGAPPDGETVARWQKLLREIALELC
jgi:HPt (histidine-containing phosphotransfer) domain-containing protein